MYKKVIIKSIKKIQCQSLFKIRMQINIKIKIKIIKAFKIIKSKIILKRVPGNHLKIKKNMNEIAIKLTLKLLFQIDQPKMNV